MCRFKKQKQNKQTTTKNPSPFSRFQLLEFHFLKSFLIPPIHTAIGSWHSECTASLLPIKTSPRPYTALNLSEGWTHRTNWAVPKLLLPLAHSRLHFLFNDFCSCLSLCCVSPFFLAPALCSSRKSWLGYSPPPLLWRYLMSPSGSLLPDLRKQPAPLSRRGTSGVVQTREDKS